MVACLYVIKILSVISVQNLINQCSSVNELHIHVSLATLI